MHYYKVSYQGFLGTVERYYYTKYHAEQWARAVGKYLVYHISEHESDYLPLTIQGGK